MAQAARLNLRMQKELKLLITDPPPGVTLPLLSHHENLPSSSLSSIEARIEGPDETVYSKGVFTIRIQIPERYPFQPPNVNFVTPIYHPNIDNGGRICLDILNLPPKGAWQPSLNISTVLTSIGLLLSEPNPDDGLMAETSREYKYNRQAFDLKARSWTEKYALPHDSGRNSGCNISIVNLSMIDAQPGIETKTSKSVSESSISETEGARKKLRLTGEKLSLKPKALAKTNTEDKENMAPTRRKLSISRSQKPSADLSAFVISEQSKVYCGQISHGDCKEVPAGNMEALDINPKEIASIVVSDSEESDDDERPLRSRLRLSLMRKKQVARIP